MTVAWTPELIEKTATLLKAGLSGSQIAKRLGISKGAVQGKVFRDERLSSIGWKNPNNGSARKAIRAPVPVRKPHEQAERVDRLYAPSSVEAQEYDKRSLRLSLHELQHHQCRWIVSGEREKAVFCGNCRKPNARLSYCDHHYRRATRERKSA